MGMVAGSQANQRMLVKLLVVAAAMFGFGFAMVPFYRALCEAVGLNRVEKSDLVGNTQVDATRTLTVEFDATRFSHNDVESALARAGLPLAHRSV